MDKESYRIYLLSDHWKEVSEKRKKIDGYKCVFCGCSESLNVHHLNYDNLWNENIELDLITLCHDCHLKMHKCMDQYKPEIQDMNERWRRAASDAIHDIAIAYREESGNHLAEVIYNLVGNKPNPNIAKIIKAVMYGLNYQAGYTRVYPMNVKQNTYTIAAQKLSKLRKRKTAQS